jgi:uncharacterized membrane protein YccC
LRFDVGDERLLVPAARLDWCAGALRGGTSTPPPVIGWTDDADLVCRLTFVVDAAVRHTAQSVRSVGAGDARGLVVHTVRRLLAHARADSVLLRNAVRTGAALGAACAIARTTGVQHGFWVELATLTVLGSTARLTGRRVIGALAGTTVGAVLAVVLIAAVGAHTAVYAALTPVTIAVAIWARSAVGFAAGQAGFTVAVLTLFSLLRPGGWHLGLLRVEDVTLGVLAALAVAAVAWPGGAARALARALDGLTDSGNAYLGAVTASSGDAPESPRGQDAETRLDGLRHRATSASLRAETAFAQLLAEGPPAPERARWAEQLSQANRAWYAADLMRTTATSRRTPWGDGGRPQDAAR